jgi:hypothetical protein
LALSKTLNRDLQALDALLAVIVGVAMAAAVTNQRHGVILPDMKKSSSPAEAIQGNACPVCVEKETRQDIYLNLESWVFSQS